MFESKFYRCFHWLKCLRQFLTQVVTLDAKKAEESCFTVQHLCQIDLRRTGNCRTELVVITNSLGLLSKEDWGIQVALGLSGSVHC